MIDLEVAAAPVSDLPTWRREIRQSVSGKYPEAEAAQREQEIVAQVRELGDSARDLVLNQISQPGIAKVFVEALNEVWRAHNPSTEALLAADIPADPAFADKDHFSESGVSPMGPGELPTWQVPIASELSKKKGRFTREELMEQFEASSAIVTGAQQNFLRLQNAVGEALAGELAAGAINSESQFNPKDGSKGYNLRTVQRPEQTSASLTPVLASAS
jgi:hypothetical protein